MKSKIVVLQDCVVRVPDMFDRSFVAGDVVDYGSRFYWALLWSGLASENGEPTEFPTPEVPPQPVWVDVNGVRNEYHIQWDETNVRWEVTDFNLIIQQKIQDALAALVNDAPAAFDTLGEIAGTLQAHGTNLETILSTLSTKAPINNPVFTGTVGGITKAMVGLGNVDNTSDVNKPVSTAQAAAIQTAINNLINSAPGTLDTLGEIAAALEADQSGLAALTDVVNTKAPINNPTFTGTVGGITKSMVGLANVDNTSDANKPVSTATQTALNGKSNTGHTHVFANLTDQLPAGKVAGTATNGYVAKLVAGVPTWQPDLDTTYSTITLTEAQAGTATTSRVLTAAVLKSILDAMTARSVNGRVGAVTLTKSDVGLANVDNTADIDKPVSTATQNAINTAINNLINGAPTTLDTLNEIAAAIAEDQGALDAINTTLGTKAPINNPTFTGTVGGITKSMVGLANVDNTSDAAKPVSTATQTALNAKEGTIAAGTTAQYWRGDKTWQALNKAAVGLGNVDNTSDLNKPISTATQTALNGKAASSHRHTTADLGASGMVPDGTKFLRDDGVWAGIGDGVFAPTGGTAGDYLRGDTTWQPLNKAAVGLANVDNTSDLNKPISTATQTALNAKEGTIAAGTTAQYWRGDKTWQALNKTAVGLGNVDNTSDAAKPISTATQTALNTKAPTASPIFSGTITQGTADTDTEKKRAVEIETHSRSTTNTYTSGKLTQVVEKSGTTTVKTTTLGYTGDLLTSVVEVAGGQTVTTTLAYTDGVLTGTTRSVA